MAKLSKATRTSDFYNPMSCHGKVIKSISIFANGLEVGAHGASEGKLIGTNKQGWLNRAKWGSNNEDLTIFDNIEFCNKRKVDLNFTESFMVKDELYINAKDLPDFKHLGEQVGLSTEEETHFGNFVEFSTGTEKRPKPVLIRVMLGTYTRSEKSTKGEALEQTEQFIKDLGVSIPKYEVRTLLENKDELIKFLSELN